MSEKVGFAVMSGKEGGVWIGGCKDKPGEGLGGKGKGRTSSPWLGQTQLMGLYVTLIITDNQCVLSN